MSNVLPLYLDLTETRCLAVAVGLMIRLDSAVLLDEEGRAMAAEEIAAQYGPAGTARADQTVAAARERLPVLRSLRTALSEHGETLSRMQQVDEEEDD